MHAGGVADNNGPWNDEKDPFEVDNSNDRMLIVHLEG